MDACIVFFFISIVPKQVTAHYMIVACTTNIIIQKKTKWLIDDVTCSFYSLLIDRAAILNCKLRVVKVPLSFQPEFWLKPSRRTSPYLIVKDLTSKKKTCLLTAVDSLTDYSIYFIWADSILVHYPKAHQPIGGLLWQSTWNFIECH